MNPLIVWGAFAFGLVVGWITYRTLRRTETKGISDIAAVIGAVGGGLVTTLFPEGGSLFGAYGIGLAVGFFAYLITAVLLAAKTDTLAAVNEWLGDSAPAPHGLGRGNSSSTSSIGVNDPPPPLPV